MTTSLKTRIDAAMAVADWRDPLRMTLAAVLSLQTARYFNLPEAFWSVLTALVITRPHLGGTLRAGAGRLAGTVCGAGLAALVAVGRHWHPPELLLLICVLLPLGFLIAFKPEYRTAPVAAIIVLSSSPLGHGPLQAAGLRIVEIGLGALVGALVSWLVFPVDSRRHSKALAAALLEKIAAVFNRLQQAPEDEAIDTAVEECRRDLRALAVEARVAPWMRRQTEQQKVFVKLMARLGGDAFFAIRMLRAQAAAQGLDDHARAMATELEQMLVREACGLRGPHPGPLPGRERGPERKTAGTGEATASDDARAAARRATQRYVAGLLKRDLTALGGSPRAF